MEVSRPPRKRSNPPSRAWTSTPGSGCHSGGSADTLRQAHAIELFAEDLRLAQHALGEITGEFTSEDLLGEIFGSFCIGK